MACFSISKSFQDVVKLPKGFVYLLRAVWLFFLSHFICKLLTQRLSNKGTE